MKFKFKLKIAMKTTAQQYVEDLKTQLRKIGYDEVLVKFSYCDYLLTSLEGNLFTNFRENIDDTFLVIYEYNPKLFLALAAMTDVPEGIDDEYYTFENSEKAGKQIWKKKAVCDLVGARKATKIELIEYFTEKEKYYKLPEKWCVKGIYPEVIEFSNKYGCYKGSYNIENNYHHYPHFNGSTTSSSIQKGYIEITLEEFLENVYNPQFGINDDSSIEKTIIFLQDKGYSGVLYKDETNKIKLL